MPSESGRLAGNERDEEWIDRSLVEVAGGLHSLDRAMDHAPDWFLSLSGHPPSRLALPLREYRIVVFDDGSLTIVASDAEAAPLGCS